MGRDQHAIAHTLERGPGTSARSARHEAVYDALVDAGKCWAAGHAPDGGRRWREALESTVRGYPFQRLGGALIGRRHATHRLRAVSPVQPYPSPRPRLALAGRRRLQAIVALAVAVLPTAGCDLGAHSRAAPPDPTVSDANHPPSARAATIELALNRHLHTSHAQLSPWVDLSDVGAAATVMLTAPVEVRYRAPDRPDLDFTVPAARVVAIEQAAGWVYGLTINPRVATPSLAGVVGLGRDLEGRLRRTAWRRVSDSPGVGEAELRAWVATTDEELELARYTADRAELRLTVGRTGQPTPSERLRGESAETYFVTVRMTDFSLQPGYQRRVLDRARATGSPVGSLRLLAFMGDTVRP